MGTTNINSTTIVVEALRKDNYEIWEDCIKCYLVGQDLWEVVEDNTQPPNEEEGKMKEWRRKNGAALHAIKISCTPDLLYQIRQKANAKDAWDALAKLCRVEEPDIQQEGSDIEQGDVGVERAHALTLFKAIHNNDLDFVKSFFKEHPDLINTRFKCIGKSQALHHAIMCGTLNIVEELIGKLSAEDAKKDDGYGYSALSYAANSGGMRMMRIAEHLIRKNEEMLTIPNGQGRIPLATACYYGHKKMAYFLYSLTRSKLLAYEDGTVQASKVLTSCISNHMFDIALDLIRLCPHLVKLKIDNPVLVLSYLTSAFPSGSKLQVWKQWVYSTLKFNPSTASNEVNVVSLTPHHDGSEITKIVNQEKLRLGGKSSVMSYLLRFLGIKQVYDLKVAHVYASQFLRLMSKTISTLDTSQMRQIGLYEAIFNATDRGITEFLVEVIGANPDLLFVYDQYERNIFQVAVAFRQEKVFSLIYGVGALKDLLSSYRDSNNDNLLHLAGHSAPQRMLNQISGAALQMQRELQWFKEVESIVPGSYKGYANANGEYPYELFEKNHKGLVSEGEKWMKDLAQSSTVVGALIITIMFAALYTVPGGNNQDTGIPLLLNEKAFKVFIVSDAISLFASSTSVLMFLGILTSRYAPQDFLKSLPTKLIIALSSLFISIAAMMVTFSATVVIMLKGKLAYIIPIVLLASIPVSLFVWLQFPLLVTIFRSTYGPGIFDRKMKKWIKNATDDER